MAPVYEDGEKTVTLKGERIAEEFQELVERYVARRYARQASRRADERTWRQRSCKPCEGGMPPLTPAAGAVSSCADLERAGRSTRTRTPIRREFAFRDFYRTMSFVNALAHIANIEDHHPDLEVGYNYCRVPFTTHAIGGLSENDFICAAKIDLIPLT